MKRFRPVLTAALTLALALSEGRAQTPSFPDVPSGHWAQEAVNRLKELGVLTGYPDGSYRGDEPVSRYQLALALYRLYALLSASLESLSGPPSEAAAALKRADLALRALEALGAEGEDADLKELRALLRPALDRLALLEEAVGQMGERLGTVSSLSDALTVAVQNVTEEALAIRKELDALSGVLTQVVGRKEFSESVQRLAQTLADLEGKVKGLEERVGALEKTGEEIRARLEAPPPFTLRGYAEARAALGEEAPRLLNDPLSAYPLAFGLTLEGRERKGEAHLYLGQTPLLRLSQEAEGVRLGANLLALSTPALALEGEVRLGEVALQGGAWYAGDARGLTLEVQAPQGGLRLLGKQGALGEERRSLQIPPLNPGEGLGGEASLRLGPATLQGYYERGQATAFGLTLGLTSAEGLGLLAQYAQVEGGEAPAVLKEGLRQAGFGLAALLAAPWAKVRVGYEWLQGGEGPLVQGDVAAEGVRLFGLYRAALNALKLAGGLKGNLGNLSISLEAAHARAAALWQAYLRGEVGLDLAGAYLALGYTEAASLGGLSPTLWDRRYDPDYPGLFEGEGAPLGSILQEASFHLTYGPLSFSYGLLLRPLLGDRFLIGYRLQIP